MDRVLIFKTNQDVTDRCANQMAAIRSFRDLNTYQRALEEAEVIFLLTRSFPKEEKYALTDQIRRSSRAVGALLAEAWARRRYRAAFVNKINAALGEAMETQAWLDHAQRCGYISEKSTPHSTRTGKKSEAC